jgi:D-alanyl-D-alanine carboxypeptidase (penicillin-binding protein 5/6)
MGPNLARILVATAVLSAVAGTATPAAAAVTATPHTATPHTVLPAAVPAALPCRGGGAAADADPLDSTGLVVPPEAKPLPTGLTANSWVVADVTSGDVLAACGAHVEHLPASTLKLLTAVTVLPRLDPSQTITVLPQDLDFEPGSSAVGLVAGGRYTTETLLLGLLLVSGNDAANVLARVAGGEEGRPGTIRAMNAEAARLGARDTVAVNPHGLDAPGQHTSAYDLAVIARAAFARTDFRRIAATPTAQIPSETVTLPGGAGKTYPGYQIQNDNKLLTTYRGALGGKTGFTDSARHTYVGVAERGGRSLVVTLMRGEQAPLRMREQAAALLDWGFALPAGTAPVGRLAEPEPAQPSPRVLAEARIRRPGAGVPGAAAGAGAGAGTVTLMVLAGLAAVVAGLRLRVRLRLARRRPVRTARTAPPSRRPQTLQQRQSRAPARRPGSGPSGPGDRRPYRDPPRPPASRSR